MHLGEARARTRLRMSGRDCSAEGEPPLLHLSTISLFDRLSSNRAIERPPLKALAASARNSVERSLSGTIFVKLLRAGWDCCAWLLLRLLAQRQDFFPVGRRRFRRLFKTYTTSSGNVASVRFLFAASSGWWAQAPVWRFERVFVSACALSADQALPRIRLLRMSSTFPLRYGLQRAISGRPISSASNMLASRRFH